MTSVICTNRENRYIEIRKFVDLKVENHTLVVNDNVNVHSLPL